MSENAFFDAHSGIPIRVLNERNLGRENVTEEDFLERMDSGNINARFASVYVEPTYQPENADVEDFLDHIDYVIDLTGIDNVGFGFDYWEYLEKYFPGDSENWGMGIEGMSDASQVSIIYQKLEERGYSEKEIRMLSRENFLCTLEEIFQL